MYSLVVAIGGGASAFFALESRWDYALAGLAATNATAFILLTIIVHRRTSRTHRSAMRTEAKIATLQRSLRDGNSKLDAEMATMGQMTERVHREARMARIAVEMNAPTHERKLVDPDMSMRIASLGEMMIQALELLESSAHNERDRER
ncbi:hypothetical protein ACIOWF_12525 [Cellulosimicrobium cellulans]|uniref:hypothetical protein n=1 Tax=Cellulosimicrobium cellulans TaxID=1710 RepID=UPI0038235FD2